MTMQKTISPVDGRVYVERALAGGAEVAAALANATRAQKFWAAMPLADQPLTLDDWLASPLAQPAVTQAIP